MKGREEERKRGRDGERDGKDGRGHTGKTLGRRVAKESVPWNLTWGWRQLHSPFLFNDLIYDVSDKERRREKRKRERGREVYRLVHTFFPSPSLFYTPSPSLLCEYSYLLGIQGGMVRRRRIWYLAQKFLLKIHSLSLSLTPSLLLFSFSLDT